MSPLASGPKRTIPCQKMLADVNLHTGGIVSAGAVQTVAPVVMQTNLQKCAEKQPCHALSTTSSECCRGNLLREAAKDRSAATAGTVVSPLNPEDLDSSKFVGYFQKTRCGSFYMHS